MGVPELAFGKPGGGKGHEEWKKEEYKERKRNLTEKNLLKQENEDFRSARAQTRREKKKK